MAKSNSSGCSCLFYIVLFIIIIGYFTGSSDSSKKTTTTKTSYTTTTIDDGDDGATETAYAKEDDDDYGDADPVIIDPEVIDPPESYSVTINGVVFGFVKCSKCNYVAMPDNDNPNRSWGETIDQEFYIMNTELTVAQYEALRGLNSDLPEIGEFNKNCDASVRNSSKFVDRRKPLHGIVPLDNKGSSSALRYAQMICDTLTDALNSNRTDFNKAISGSKTAGIPTAVQWYYAAVAANSTDDIKRYCHLGTIAGREYLNENCLAILLESPAASSLESIQVTYMGKYWKMIWDESGLSTESFNATPNQIITMIENKDRLKISDSREDINDIIKNMPLTYLRCLLYNKPADSATYLYDSSISVVKQGELPNNWGLYDVHSNVSELVLDRDSPTGYCIMGGQNNLSLDSGWEDNWLRYMLWKKVSPRDLNKHTMPGLRLIFTVE